MIAEAFLNCEYYINKFKRGCGGEIDNSVR